MRRRSKAEGVHEWCYVLCVRWKRPTVLRHRRSSVRSSPDCPVRLLRSCSQWVSVTKELQVWTLVPLETFQPLQQIICSVFLRNGCEYLLCCQARDLKVGSRVDRIWQLGKEETEIKGSAKLSSMNSKLL
ncbi:hypothetical protein CY35_14G106200 [Sphagnum magellanicum]|nr:hypothetical protein CY35_14G106200 [Sphagnum magellanicum]